MITRGFSKEEVQQITKLFAMCRRRSRFCSKWAYIIHVLFMPSQVIWYEPEQQSYIILPQRSSICNLCVCIWSSTACCRLVIKLIIIGAQNLTEKLLNFWQMPFYNSWTSTASFAFEALWLITILSVEYLVYISIVNSNASTNKYIIW